MGTANQTCVKEIVLLGFSDFQEMQTLLFVLVSISYVAALTGNMLIVFLILRDPALHTPMYFFLGNFSFLEVCYTSVILPKMLVDLLSETPTITLMGCGFQMFFFNILASTECFLLSVMAYDRYVAICKPLQYTLIMTRRICAQMSAFSWNISICMAIWHFYSIFTKPFCGSNQISHFFCDIVLVMRLPSTDTYMNEVSVTALTVPYVMVPFLLILFSYTLIISTILKMPSVKGRRKAFSTCSSHLIMVSLFYGTGTVVYLQPSSSHTQGNARFFALVYTVMTPVCNPIVYSLRNKEIKSAFKKSIGREMCPHIRSLKGF
ncbi:olfactory receptor 10AG1-like [Alligator sinensis]|uniref:Olfactory receptor n=1 Tax=Alligator sinensis TaxID=38654 RepID=A0A1U8DMU7_ALLSI|nr:olfactory receptor 10AG1-like [Alligator sinensis]